MAPPVSVLMVAEKPSIALSIAKALGGHHFQKSQKNTPTPVFEYDGDFHGHAAFFRVTSVTGHVFSIDFTGRYNNWDGCDPTELFDAPVVRKEANPKSHMVNHLSNLAKDTDVLVLWLDCDREGENICFEVMSIVCPKMKNDRLHGKSLLSDKNIPTKARGVPTNVYRVKFSSLVESDLRKAFVSSLTVPNVNESESVEARQEMDLKVGVAFTRFFSRYFLNKYGNLDSKLISYGPCQLPTLWFCVKQKLAQEQFQPEPYWTIHAGVRPGGAAASETAKWMGGDIFDKDAARLIQTVVKECTTARIVNKQTKKSKVKRPEPLNTVSMLKDASSIYGIGPQRAMQVAEQLYLRGLVTYPRTESTAFPSAFDLTGTLKMLERSSVGGRLASHVLETGVQKPRKGTDMGDHPPIVPCGPAPSDLTSEQEQIYRLVAERFVSCLSGDATYEDTKVTLATSALAPATFVLSESKLVDPGFMFASRSSTASTRTGSSRLSSMSIGDSLDITSVELERHETTRPGLLSESRLLGAMEKHGIGTDASMATHIQNIMDRNYVRLLPTGRLLEPTKLGVAFCEGLERVDAELCRPIVRGIIEKQCLFIAQGKADKKKVVDHVLNEFKLKFQYVLRKITRVEELFEISFTTVAQSGSMLSRCGKCNRYMVYVAKRPQRLICTQCSIIFKVPQNATIRTWSDNRCVLDNYETLLATERSGRCYPFCPMCFTDPPSAHIKGIPSCLNNPGGLSQFDKRIDECYKDDCDGNLCLQDYPGCIPALACTVCDVMIRLDPSKIRTISKAPTNCPECGWAKIKVNLLGANRFTDDTSSRTSCLGCDEEMQSLLAEGSQRFGKKKGKGRGRGRGRKAMTDAKMSFDRF